MKLMPATRPITTKNPTLLSDRCGVSSAEKSAGSGAAGAVEALLSFIAALYRLDGKQDDPQGCKDGAGETQKIRQAKAMDPGRSGRGVPPLQKGKSRAQDRACAHQPVHAAGRCRAFRAGDRRRRQQGDTRVVRR